MRWARTGLLLAAGGALLSSCFLDFRTPELWLETRPWYNTTEILIPFDAYGDSGIAYARYRIEYDVGFGWELQTEREIQLPSGSSGVIEYNAPDPSAPYRLTFSLLSSRDASSVPTPFITEVRIFRVDFDAPGATFAIGDLVPAPGLQPAANALRPTINDFTVFNDGGSGVGAFYTLDGSVPTEWDPSVWSDFDQIHIWDPGQYSSGNNIVLRLMFVDNAGNRSGVFTTTYTAN